MSGISRESIEASTARMQAARKAMSGSSDCPWSVDPYASSGRRLAYLNDAQILAIAYLDRLAADLAERDERARLIDAEWLESIGFANTGLWMSIRVGPVELTWDRVCGLWVDVARPLSAVKTRGQLLDLLRVLKGGA